MVKAVVSRAVRLQACECCVRKPRFPSLANMRLKGFWTAKKQHMDKCDLICKLYWIFVVMFRFLSKLAIKILIFDYIL